MPEKKTQAASSLPQVDLVLRREELAGLGDSIKREILARLVREELDSLRQAILSADGASATTDKESLAGDVARKVARTAGELARGGVRRVINGTGVLLNTNLGRAPLPVNVLDRLHDLGQGYTSLEYDLRTGKRGERTAMVSRLMSLITGCESAIVVNNNASSVMLAVSSLANGKEVIVSRGELIEIGGAFRLPDVVTSAGGILKEVGTTNRTRASDYASAISERTGIMLRCHRSNFEISGFTEEADPLELSKISRDSGIPLVDDLGSGALFDLSRLGLAPEPTVDAVVAQGAGLVMFSGDKLLGGPQAGIIAGKKDLVARLRKNPMYRALRADKLIISLIEIVLSNYLRENPEAYVPVINLAMVENDLIKERVEAMLARLNSLISEEPKVEYAAVESQSALGGGSLPGRTQPSFALEIRPASKAVSAAAIAQALRESDPAVVSTIKDERVQIDFRTVLARDEDDLLAILSALPDRLAIRSS